MLDRKTSAPRSPSRRLLLKAGVAGGAALLLARWFTAHDPALPATGARLLWLDAQAQATVAAIVPVMLGDALPRDAAQSARDEVVAGVDRTVMGLPPAVRKEVSELFALLGFAPTRMLVAGVWTSWDRASPAEIGAFLDAWRDSRFALLRSGYAALHQLVYAAWYGNPRAWAAIGYAGPPSLGGDA